MVCALEIQVEQKKRLFQLLRFNKMNDDAYKTELKNLIVATKAEMQQEDVAWVEKQVAEIE